MTARSIALSAATIAAVLAASCSRSDPGRSGSAKRGVTVAFFARAASEGGFTAYGPLAGSLFDRSASGSYGPGLSYSRTGGIAEPQRYEVTNHGPGQVGWVCWKRSYVAEVPREMVPAGPFLSDDEPNWRLRRPYKSVPREEVLASACPLAPGESVLLTRSGEGPWWYERSGRVLHRLGSGLAGTWYEFPGDSQGRIGSVRSGRSGAPPRGAGLLVRYTGPAWLAPTGKFRRERLDALLAELPGAGAVDRERIMWSLAWSSQAVNGRLPLVKRPEIVAAFVGELLKATPPAASAAPADDEEHLGRAPAFGAFEYALLVLLDLVPPGELRRHADVLGALAAQAGDRRVAELLVKAGAAKALAELAGKPDRLPKEGRDDLVRAVKAGSGDDKAFASLVEAFDSEKTPARKAALGRLLALVGREEGLKAVAGGLRDEREYERGGTRVVYCELADALRLALPEQPSLYAGGRRTREWRVELEKFCTGRFGVQYPGELPPDPEAPEPVEVRTLRDPPPGQEPVKPGGPVPVPVPDAPTAP